jgi:hypothetical protein
MRRDEKGLLYIYAAPRAISMGGSANDSHYHYYLRMILILILCNANAIATHYHSHLGEAVGCRVTACNDCRLVIIHWNRQCPSAGEYERLSQVN